MSNLARQEGRAETHLDIKASIKQESLRKPGLEADNVVAAGLNKLVDDAEKAMKRGSQFELRQIGEQMKSGLELAEQHGLGLVPAEALKEHLHGKLKEHAPEIKLKLLEKGAQDIEFGFPDLVKLHRQELANHLAAEKEEVREPGAAAGSQLERKAPELVEFDKNVQAAFETAPGIYLESLQRSISFGCVGLLELHLGKFERLVTAGKEYGVIIDEATWNDGVNKILRNIAPKAVEKAFSDIAGMVGHGYLSLLATRIREIKIFLATLEERGIELPNGSEQVEVVAQERARQGIVAKLEDFPRAIAVSVGYGFASAYSRELKVVEEYYEAGKEMKVPMPDKKEVLKRVDAQVVASIDAGFRSIFNSTIANLREGRFKSFRTDPVTDAHSRIDEMQALAHKLGSTVDVAALYHELIDKAVVDLNIKEI